MNHWEILVGGIALAAGLWGHIKATFAWFRGLVIVTVWRDCDALPLLAGYLGEHGRKIAGQPVYAADQFYVRPLGRTAYVPSENFRLAGGLFWFRRRPVWLRKADKPLIENNIDFQLSVIRGTVDIPQLLRDAAAWRGDPNAHANARHQVVYHYGRSLTD